MYLLVNTPGERRVFQVFQSKVRFTVYSVTNLHCVKASKKTNISPADSCPYQSLILFKPRADKRKHTSSK